MTLFLKFRINRLGLLMAMSLGFCTQLSFSQLNNTKNAVASVDPKSIDLTQPTLFLVPYSHLDDVWRWSYPQVIRDFLKQTLDDNFVAFEKHPNYVFNWSGASRYQMTKSIILKNTKSLKNGWQLAGGIQVAVRGSKMM